MAKYDESSMCSLYDADDALYDELYDVSYDDLRLINDIADIEEQIQPFDNWNPSTIKDVLYQDINKCCVLKVDNSGQKFNSDDNFHDVPIETVDDNHDDKRFANNEGIVGIKAIKNIKCDKRIGSIKGIKGIKGIKSNENDIDIEGNDIDKRNKSEIETTKNNTVIAYCIFSTVFEVAEVLRIGTHPNFQRCGYAECLLKTVINHLSHKGLEKILLEVRSDNTAAIKLYEKLGFRKIHTRKNYYAAPNNIERQPDSEPKSVTESGCDALIMERKL